MQSLRKDYGWFWGSVEVSRVCASTWIHVLLVLNGWLHVEGCTRTLSWQSQCPFLTAWTLQDGVFEVRLDKRSQMLKLEWHCFSKLPATSWLWQRCAISRERERETEGDRSCFLACLLAEVAEVTASLWNMISRSMWHSMAHGRMGTHHGCSQN